MRGARHGANEHGDGAFDMLFNRFPAMQLDGSFEHLPFKHDQVVYGLYELPISLRG